MPVYNEGRFIEQTLRQLLAQEYPADRYEILVADGMSTDTTREIVRTLANKFPKIRLLDNPKRKSSAGRNVGFQNGRGKYFLVVDGHCYIPNNQLLTSVADCFRTSGADCLGRPQPLAPPDLTAFQQAVALARESWLGHGGDSVVGRPACRAPISRTATCRRVDIPFARSRLRSALSCIGVHACHCRSPPAPCC